MTHQQLQQALCGFWWGLTVTSAFVGGLGLRRHDGVGPVNCADCGTAVELKVLRNPEDRRRWPPYLVDADGSGMRRHYCEPPEIERETWDSCNSCGGLWVRFGDGPRLDLATHHPHVCKPVKPEPPTPHTNGSVEPPRRWPEPSRETKFL